MTKEEIFIQIVSEAMNQPREAVVESLRQFEAVNKKPLFAVNKELSDSEAEELISSLRKELPGIRQWFEIGAINAMDRTMRGK